MEPTDESDGFVNITPDPNEPAQVGDYISAISMALGIYPPYFMVRMDILPRKQTGLPLLPVAQPLDRKPPPLERRPAATGKTRTRMPTKANHHPPEGLWMKPRLTKLKMNTPRNLMLSLTPDPGLVHQTDPYPVNTLSSKHILLHLILNVADPVLALRPRYPFQI
jgi:hypothetical protein